MKILNEIECRYLVNGREVGESGTEHIQGYIEFDHPQRLAGLKKILERAHWEQRKGTPKQASLYCKKDGQWEERGELPKQGARSDLAKVAEQVRDGVSLRTVAETDPGTYVRYYRGLQNLKDIQSEHRTEPPIVTWLWGRTGSGKTRMATSGADFYMKDGTKWWDGYTQQKTIVIDDFDGQWPFRDLLRLLDRYPYQGQTKGGYVKINSPEIYITCEFEPKHFWTTNELAQILRRISKVLYLNLNGTEVAGTEVDG